MDIKVLILGRKWIVGDRVWSSAGKIHQVVSTGLAVMLQDERKEAVVIGMQQTLEQQGFQLATF